MKAGWTTATLSEVCEFQRGLTYAKSDEVDTSRNVVLRANNIDLVTNRLDLTDLRFISDAVVIPAIKRVRRDSLLVCTASGSKAHLGKVAFIDTDYDFAFGGFMGQLTPGEQVLPKFLFYMMISEAYKDFIASLSDGANINNLKFTDLGRFRIPIPPLPEQRRIVALLDEAFAGLATAAANAERNLDNARELFESHLAEVFSRRGDGWVEQRLEDITEPESPITYGVVKPGPEGEIPFVRGGDLVDGRVRIEALRTITEEVSGQYSRTLLRGGELLICLVGQPGAVAVAPPELAGANIARQVGLIRLRTEVGSEFVWMYLQSRSGRSALGARESGSVQQVINLTELRQVMVPLPPIDMQREIVGKLTILLAESGRLSRLYEQKRAALAKLKKSLLHQAFSGNL